MPIRSFRIDHPGYESLEGQIEMDKDCPKPDMRTVTLTRMVEIDLNLVLFNWDKDGHQAGRQEGVG